MVDIDLAIPGAPHERFLDVRRSPQRLARPRQTMASIIVAIAAAFLFAVYRAVAVHNRELRQHLAQPRETSSASGTASSGRASSAF